MVRFYKFYPKTEQKIQYHKQFKTVSIDQCHIFQAIEQKNQKYEVNHFVEHNGMPQYAIAQIHTRKKMGWDAVGWLVDPHGKTTDTANNKGNQNRDNVDISGGGIHTYYLFYQFNTEQTSKQTANNGFTLIKN